MTAISYVAAALPEPSLCLPAANALRDLCDSNRAVLAPHIASFAELHAGLTDVPVCWISLSLLLVSDAYVIGHGENESVAVNRQRHSVTASCATNTASGGMSQTFVADVNIMISNLYATSCRRSSVRW